MWLQLLIKVVLLPYVLSVPLEPGQQGGPWTEEEIDIVREKINRMMDCGDENFPDNPESCWRVPGLPDNLEDERLEQYSINQGYQGPRDQKDPREIDRMTIRYKWKNIGVAPNQLIQLSFHDCLRYEDGSGGCDGCLNWEGVGYSSPRALAKIRSERKKKYYRAYPIARKTNNNKLQLAARSLELMFTVPNWPPGARSLTTSLKETGKSRADLWQFAANVALEKVINETNTLVCIDSEKWILNLDPNTEADKCEINLSRPVPFRWGRIDCIPEESKKWTPYPFEATKAEKHSNPFATGTEIIKDLKEDYDFTAKETISLMTLHGMARVTKNFEQFLKYKWIGGMREDTRDTTKRGIFHRLYYKILNGKTYLGNGKVASMDPGRTGKILFGDRNGYPVGGSAFYIDCKGQWNNTERIFPGPCHFRPTQTGCNPNALISPDLQMVKPCFQLNEAGVYVKNTISGCDAAKLVEKEGLLYQIGGPLESSEQLCKPITNLFMFPYEAGFVLNFTVAEDNTPQGCGTLDGEWRKENQRPVNEPDFIYPGSPGYNGSPPCGFNTYAPEGEASSDIVTLFAQDHDAWQEAFFNAWEKMGMNGYDKETLTEGPANGQLVTPFMS